MAVKVLAAIEFFNSFEKEKLKDQNFLEHTLIPNLGLNNEILNEQPKELHKYFGGGFGLKIWQYPNQFSKYLCFLNKYKEKINSYLEIGCRNGGTFFLHCQYLTPLSKAVALDLVPISDTLSDFNAIYKGASYIQASSHSKKFIDFIKNNFFDLIFIDGDHSYDGVKKDAENTRDKCNIQVFHDIVNDACLGVSRYWQEVKKSHSDVYDFFEFTDQYDSVNGNYLGIGVAVRKKWVSNN